MQITCRSDAGHMQITCRSRADQMQVTCRSHADHMQITCRSHADHVQITCRSRADHVQITCRSHTHYLIVWVLRAIWQLGNSKHQALSANMLEQAKRARSLMLYTTKHVLTLNTHSSAHECKLQMCRSTNDPCEYNTHAEQQDT